MLPTSYCLMLLRDMLGGQLWCHDRQCTSVCTIQSMQTHLCLMMAGTRNHLQHCVDTPPSMAGSH